MLDRILTRLKSEPALVRAVIYGVIAVLTGGVVNTDTLWEEVAALLVLVVGGFDIRRKVSPVNKDNE